MTRAQRIHLLVDIPARGQVSLWTAACQRQGWDRNDRELRLKVFSEALGRPIKSSTDVGTVDDFTRLKAHLLALAEPDNLEAQVRQATMSRTNLLVRIRSMADPALIQHLLRDRFTWPVWVRREHPEWAGATISRVTNFPAPDWLVAEYRDARPAPPSLDDLTDLELVQLRNTLSSKRPKPI